MTKATLTTKLEPTYDDLPEERYHFPHTYLRQIEASVGDWIVYYEPRRASGDLASGGGRQAYFATARIQSVQADPSRAGHYYAFISDYLEFDRPVLFREGGQTYERALTKDDGSTNKGAFGRSVRTMSDAEYDLILQAGYAHTIGAAPRERPGSLAPEDPPAPIPGLGEDQQAIFEPELIDRRIVTQLVARPFRERAFAAAVKSAYGDTCAMTGIRIINGGGRSEVQAAHIRPVADRGPDSVRNGLALSGTMHWLFDRGLVSIDDDRSILVAAGRVPDTIERLLRPERRLTVPSTRGLAPAPTFLKYHRETVFKG